MMKTSDRGLMALISFEGIVLTTYKDSKGILTVGIGHTKAAGSPDPASLVGVRIDGKAAVAMFRKDIEQYERYVNDILERKPSQHQFDAMVSFCYNAGPAALAKAYWIKSFNAGDDVAAAKQIMNWVKPPELKPRRIKEQAMFRDAIYPLPFAILYSDVDDNLRPIKGRSLSLDQFFDGSNEIQVPEEGESKVLKGYRTIIVNALLAGAEPMLKYLVGVGWVEFVGPTYAMIIVFVINTLLRWITNTPVGKSN